MVTVIRPMRNPPKKSHRIYKAGGSPQGGCALAGYRSPPAYSKHKGMYNAYIYLLLFFGRCPEVHGPETAVSELSPASVNTFEKHSGEKKESLPAPFLIQVANRIASARL